MKFCLQTFANWRNLLSKVIINVHEIVIENSAAHWKCFFFLWKIFYRRIFFFSEPQSVRPGQRRPDCGRHVVHGQQGRRRRWWWRWRSRRQVWQCWGSGAVEGLQCKYFAKLICSKCNLIELISPFIRSWYITSQFVGPQAPLLVPRFILGSISSNLGEM